MATSQLIPEPVPHPGGYLAQAARRRGDAGPGACGQCGSIAKDRGRSYLDLLCVILRTNLSDVNISMRSETLRVRRAPTSGGLKK